MKTTNVEINKETFPYSYNSVFIGVLTSTTSTICGFVALEGGIFFHLFVLIIEEYKTKKMIIFLLIRRYSKQ